MLWKLLKLSILWIYNSHRKNGNVGNAQTLLNSTEQFSASSMQQLHSKKWRRVGAVEKSLPVDYVRIMNKSGVEKNATGIMNKVISLQFYEVLYRIKCHNTEFMFCHFISGGDQYVLCHSLSNMCVNRKQPVYLIFWKGDIYCEIMTYLLRVRWL